MTQYFLIDERNNDIYLNHNNGDVVSALGLKRPFFKVIQADTTMKGTPFFNADKKYNFELDSYRLVIGKADYERNTARKRTIELVEAEYPEVKRDVYIWLEKFSILWNVCQQALNFSPPENLMAVRYLETIQYEINNPESPSKAIIEYCKINDVTYLQALAELKSQIESINLARMRCMGLWTKYRIAMIMSDDFDNIIQECRNSLFMGAL